MLFYLTDKGILPALDAEFPSDHLVTLVLTSKLSQIYTPQFNVNVHLCRSKRLNTSIESSLKRWVGLTQALIVLNDFDKFLFLSLL